MIKIFKGGYEKERGGSALLIVLGFLSFMIISAVAFAVYMRIERQASSNYRHASNARHLLNAALYRAIDEIDSELRATSIPENGSNSPNKRKFPAWRVRNSAVVNSADNSGDARVLTMDALSYIPAILVNDVRADAVKPRNPGANKTYEGPKWRAISMPDRNMQGDPAYREAVVGRYAYACINLSDMLNVNDCKAAVRDLDRYRVSLAHLFSSQSARDTFDDNVEGTDHHYSTLSDFYACMHKRNDPVFGSPYHDYLTKGDDVAFDNAENHILVTDGKAMAELGNQGAFNLKRGVFQTALDADPPQLKTDFKSALKDALANSSSDLSGHYESSALPHLLADYLDADNIPKRSDIPSVEVAPMLCQFVLNDPGAIQIFSKEKVTMGPDDDEVDVIYIDLNKILPLMPLNASIKVMYPFLRTDYLTNIETEFEVDVNAFLRIHADNPQSIIPEPPTPAGGYYLAFMNDPAGSSYTPPTNVRSSGTPYGIVGVTLAPVPLGTEMKIPIWDSGNIGSYPFNAGDRLKITLYITFMGIREKNSGLYVDMIPTYNGGVANPTPPTGGANAIQTRLIAADSIHRLYLATSESGALGGGFNENVALNFQWTGLETPDARFNHKVSNWIQSGAVVANTHNPSTLSLLRDGTGRDPDVYISVSNTEKMYSPGELGNIIRPFNYTPTAGPVVDFSAYDYGAFLARDDNDSDAMFRTYRLYDHGDPSDTKKRRHDDLFEWFYASNPDGSFNGPRVNPLSDIPLVLGAASENIPLDYWLAREITIKTENEDFSGAKTLIEDNNYSELLTGTSWDRFTNGWFHCLLNARNNTDINTDLNQNLRDVYNSNEYFGWYSEFSELNKVFNPENKPSAPGVSYPVSLSQELYGVDRKMLYSYTLDSFSDRQQLFLYIINAEATAASFGDKAQSLAGGRAIALVWRDPYPARKTPDATPVQPPNMFYGLISPWHQHYVGSDDYRSKKTDNDPDGLARDIRYFDHKILFFKYLER